MIDTVLFDFDGTLMDTTDVIVGSWQHTFVTLTGREGELEKIYRTFGEILRDSMVKMFPDSDPDEAVEIYRSYHRNNFGERIKVFPGMKELLAELKARGIKTAVVTSRAGVTTVEGLESYGLSDYFDALVTCDDTDRHKPDPEPVNIALKKLASKPENALMIGDSMYDIMCARNAGVKSVLVGWQLAVTPEEINGEAGPDYTVETAEEILNLI